MTALTESTVEAAALAWLKSLGWNVAHGPNIAPNTSLLWHNIQHGLYWTTIV